MKYFTRERWLARLRPFRDPGVVVLLLVSMVPLAILDRAMAITLLQWTLYVLALGGLSILLSMVMVPSLRFWTWAEKASGGSTAAAIVVFGMLLNMGLIFIGVVLWARG